MLPMINKKYFEKWKTFPYNENYEVSTFGRVRSIDRKSYHPYSGIRKLKGKVLSNHCSRGLLYVDLYEGPDRTRYGVHQLVLITFVGSCPEGMEVCHYDGDSKNNCLHNLRYDTHSANELDKLRHGTKCKQVKRSDGKIFSSFKEAAKIMKTVPSNISRAIRTGYSARGYKWYLVTEKELESV